MSVVLVTYQMLDVFQLHNLMCLPLFHLMAVSLAAVSLAAESLAAVSLAAVSLVTVLFLVSSLL